MSHRCVVLCLAVCFMCVFSEANGQDTPSLSTCADRLESICRDTAEDPSVCRLLAPLPAETLQTISGFFNAISRLPEQQRQDLICARFGSSKVIRGLGVYSFRSGYFTSKRFDRVSVACAITDTSSHDRFEDAASKVRAYGGIPPAGPDEVNVVGTLERVNEQAETHGIVLNPCRITEMYRSGDIVTFDELTREAKAVTRAQYMMFMEAGLFPPDVTLLTATPEGNAVTLLWKNPTIPDLQSIRIVYRTDRYPTQFNDGTVIYEGSHVSFTHTGLTFDSPNYYGVFVLNTAGRYSKGAQVEARTKCSPLVTNASVVIQGNVAVISWTNPTCSFSGNIFVTRQKDHPSSRWDDGDIVCRTREPNCNTGVFPNETETYHFSAFVPFNGDYGFEYYRTILGQVDVKRVEPPVATPPAPPTPSPSSISVPATPQKSVERSSFIFRLVQGCLRQWRRTDAWVKIFVCSIVVVGIIYLLAVTMSRRLTFSKKNKATMKDTNRT